jgi:hypothetical protein
MHANPIRASRFQPDSAAWRKMSCPGIAGPIDEGKYPGYQIRILLVLVWKKTVSGLA